MRAFLTRCQSFLSGYRTLKTASFITVLASIMIIVTGAVVRVTGSGLGCDTWPNCSAENLTATKAMGIHSYIEFGNRMLTFVLCVAVGWLIIVASFQKRKIRGVLMWAWLEFAMVVLNAVVGGITVWMRLSPYVVALHFLAAMALLTATVGNWDKVCTHPDNRAPSANGAPLSRAVSPLSNKLGTAILVVSAVTIVLGTLVTGSGPHAGDSSKIQRMPFNWAGMSVIHGAMALLVVVLTVWLLIVARQRAEGLVILRSRIMLLVLVAQAAVGIIQALTHLPEWLVVIHLLLAALMWIGALRLFMDTRLRAASPDVEPARADLVLN